MLTRDEWADLFKAKTIEIMEEHDYGEQDATLLCLVNAVIDILVGLEWEPLE